MGAFSKPDGLLYNQIMTPPILNHYTQPKQRKTDVPDEDRKHECKQCDKKYLSYPALYTHIKTKHGLTSGTPINTGSTRGRGRPKKNADAPEENKAKTKDYFSHENRKGKTTDVLAALDEIILDLYQIKDHPMRKAVEYMIDPNKHTSKSKTCDDCLAEYLIHVADLTKKEFFKVVAKFVLLYRDCFNGSAEGRRSTTEDADKFPEKSNDFVTSFIGDKMENSMAIELTQNLCEWLFNQSYTCLKISLISS